MMLRRLRPPSLPRVLDLVPEVVFTIAFAISYALSQTPFITADSGGYIRTGESITVADQPEQAMTWGTLSLTGDSFRAWPTTLFYALVPGGDAPVGNWGRILLQSLLVLIVTIWLARRLAQFVPARHGWILRGFVFLFALTPTALTHTFTIGAEGPTYVLALATCAIALELPRRVRADASWTEVGVSLGAVWLLSLVAMIARPSALPLFLVVMGVGGTLLVTRRFRRTWLERLGPALGVLALVVLSVSYASLNGDNQSEAWGEVNERAYRMFHAVDVGMNPQFAAEVREGLPSDAPACLTEYPDTQLDWTAMGDYGRTVCGDEGLDWIQENYFTAMVAYYVDDPRNTIAYFSRTAADAATPWVQQGEVESVSPPVTDDILFSDRGADGRNLPLLFLAITVVTGAVMAWRVGRGGAGLLRPAAENLTLLLLGAAAWVAFFLSFFDIPVAVARKQWPFYMLATVIGLTIAWAAVHGVARRRDEDAREQDPPPASSG
jgi:hypothetical protein